MSGRKTYQQRKRHADVVNNAYSSKEQRGMNNRDIIKKSLKIMTH